MRTEQNGKYEDARVRQDASHRRGGGTKLRDQSNGTLSGTMPRERAEERPSTTRLASPHPWYGALKRFLDVVGTVLLLAPALLILGLAALLVLLFSGHPILYSQVRIGRGGREYTICKIRTMVHNSESATGARWATTCDSRITRVGRFLRRYHIDELPQLWSVLVGEMSLVGPRPERPEFLDLLADAIPGYEDRHAVRPGMTGLAQVQLRPDEDVEMVRRKVKYDLYYIQHSGFLLDLRILATTVYYLLQVHHERVAEWLRVPSGAAVEATRESPSLDERTWLDQVYTDTKVLPETRVGSKP